MSTPDNPRATGTSRAFPTLAALILVALVLTGFHHFYFEGRAYPGGRPITPPIRSLVILHGIAMAGWMLLFLVQPLLILARNRKLHMRLGILAAFFAAAVVAIGIKLGIESARVKPEAMRQFGMSPSQFLAIPVISMVFFAVSVGLAIATRKRPPLHRSLMLTGTLFAMTAAIARIDALTDLYRGTVLAQIWGPFFMTVVLAFVLLALKGLLSRSLDRPLAAGCVALAILLALNAQFAVSPTWASIAAVLMR